MSKPLWTPSPQRIANANITRFIAYVANEFNVVVTDYPSLYQWSIDKPADFWLAVWRFSQVKSSRSCDQVLADGNKLPGAQWFLGARFNFAENLLRRRDNEIAIIFRSEDQQKRSLTYAELYQQVSNLASALSGLGIGVGDRVAAYMPNMPETVIAMLATTSLGAIWSSCSPDFGVAGASERFGQITPKVLFCADGYFFKGQRIDSISRVAEISRDIPSIEKTIVVNLTGGASGYASIANATSFEEFTSGQQAEEICFAQLPFDHPLYILYSSGTTGLPKCIVHGAGGTLLQHLKEHLLHVDIKPDDRVFYYTTCGWMMWNWLVSGLASGATLMLYDGSPFYPTASVLWDFADEEGASVFGCSAKYISALEKAGVKPKQSHSLDNLATILSTGSPLLPESYDYVYRDIKNDVQLSSVSGGTDIVSCFALGCPILPVYRGELQCRGLGMKVAVYDEAGERVNEQFGELVCEAPAPSMPLYFWNDENDKRFHQAYFDRYPDVWVQGDYAQITEHQGLVITGRSDAILNPGGVRIGTAEIYRQVEKLPEIMESIVIGQHWQDDVRVVLFVKLQAGLDLTDELIKSIKSTIRANETPRHVPAKVIQVEDIPRTLSGKLVELAVRNIVHKRPVTNVDALANPEALAFFENLTELES